MQYYYLSKIAALVSAQDPELAVRFYNLTALRPSSVTCKRVANDTGVTFTPTATPYGGNIYFGSRNSIALIIKKINDVDEVERMKAIAADARLLHPSITTFEILESQAQSMLICMPRFVVLSELSYPMSTLGLSKMVETLLSALRHLDQHGYHHMDVKEANIASDHNGRGILIDLGSVAKTGELTCSTEKFVPSDLLSTFVHGRMYSRKEIDFWMLAVTFYFTLRGGTRLSPTPTRSTCLEFLRSYPETNPGAEVALAPLFEALSEVYKV